ncbi:hypothetical protein [Thermocrinis minervae]|uniref:Tetratricopeptide repeat-containing protein n=1 Tax=Thermocrinis minervae TaxID=381751 RepID=A0A1M6TAC6_9AQUI|nr:hypothetical protein [Thermocrinis minervae]SHK53917.1 hypothetical protein SAMN05444391_1369 [Thermocrinis minervae]
MLRVFKIFREKGGILKALDLWDWYESLSHKEQKSVKYYFSLKTIKNLRFPFRAKHFDSGEVEVKGYTRCTFLGSLAQTALLEGDYQTAEWLYLQALGFAQNALEKHLVLNDLVMLAQKIKDFEKMEKYARTDVELFKEYKEDLKQKNGGKLGRINSLEVYVYLLERKGKRREALELLEEFVREGVEYPFYEDVRKRLLQSA